MTFQLVPGPVKKALNRHHIVVVGAFHMLHPFTFGIESLGAFETLNPIDLTQADSFVVLHQVLSFEFPFAFTAREPDRVLFGHVQFQIVTLHVIFSFKLFAARRAHVINEFDVFEDLRQWYFIV